jgi:hypothetical protein
VGFEVFVDTPLGYYSVHHYMSAMKTELTGIARYQPLVVILLLQALVAAVLPLDFMHGFMGLFFVSLAMFKLFDISGFANGFQKYDAIAKPFRPYAYIYPFLELALGLGYLSQCALRETYIATIILMTISAAGVVREIARGNKFQCACLGTALQVPLSTVSIVENLGMGLMAVWMLAAL